MIAYYVDITPVFVAAGVEPITFTEVVTPYEAFGEYIEPTEATLEALRDLFDRFDVLNEPVFLRIVHDLCLMHRYEPGYLNRHSAEWCVALAVVGANTCKDLEGKDFSEYLRWLDFIQHGHPLAAQVRREWQERLVA